VVDDAVIERVPLLAFRVRGFGEPLDRGEPPVPLGGKLSHGPGGLVKAVGFDPVAADASRQGWFLGGAVA
jgi:hypothetical protein